MRTTFKPTNKPGVYIDSRGKKTSGVSPRTSLNKLIIDRPKTNVSKYLDQGVTKKWQGDMEAKECLYKELKDSTLSTKEQERILFKILWNVSMKAQEKLFYKRMYGEI